MALLTILVEITQPVVQDTASVTLQLLLLPRDLEGQCEVPPESTAGSLFHTPAAAAALAQLSGRTSAPRQPVAPED